MKQPGMELYYQYNLAKDGKVYKKSRRRVAHSFVTGFTKFLYGCFGNTIATTEDTGSTSRDFNHFANGAVLNAAAGADTHGLVVGTDNTAVNVGDYALVAQVDHGAAAGELQYSACTVALPDFTSSTAELTITRLFTNASGGTIAIEEIGIYFYGGYIAVGSRYVCLARDLATISVPNGSTLTLNYVIQTTL